MNWIFGLGLGLGLAIAPITAALAVLPASVGPDSQVEWSRVIDDRFDGRVVYDRNFDPGGRFIFVSRWSTQDIRATYIDCQTNIIGYRPTWRIGGLHGRGWRRDFFPYDDEPIYRRICQEASPQTIRFAINGQQYTYDGGPVATDLAAALASAPAENMIIRLVWKSGDTRDIAIGKDTVAAWRVLFKGKS